MTKISNMGIEGDGIEVIKVKSDLKCLVKDALTRCHFNNNMNSSKKNTIAIWAITPNGVLLAKKLAKKLPEVDLFISGKFTDTSFAATSFRSFSEALSNAFYQYTSHIFIMSTGIVVRVIAPLIRSKIEDPAIVVVDDQGNHAVSLLSGHIGGANALAITVAELIGARPVITTATDVNQIVAIDVLAKEKQLYIETPQAIKTVNMALLKGENIYLHDPFGLMVETIPHSMPWSNAALNMRSAPDDKNEKTDNLPRVFIDDVRVDLPPDVLILRPPTLFAGIGCNRNTRMEEIKDLFERVFEQFHLARGSLNGIASIKLKADEPGLLALADSLDLPLYFYDKEELNQVKEIKNPSAMVEKHVGVKSVCEAAAILAAQRGTLVVPKQTTPDVTVAVARIAFMS
jgi:cobalt-precorrin 5A hydrolase